MAVEFDPYHSADEDPTCLLLTRIHSERVEQFRSVDGMNIVAAALLGFEAVLVTLLETSSLAGTWKSLTSVAFGMSIGALIFCLWDRVAFMAWYPDFRKALLEADGAWNKTHVLARPFICAFGALKGALHFTHRGLRALWTAFARWPPSSWRGRAFRRRFRHSTACRFEQGWDQTKALLRPRKLKAFEPRALQQLLELYEDEDNSGDLKWTPHDWRRDLFETEADIYTKNNNQAINPKRLTVGLGVGLMAVALILFLAGSLSS
ncbi:hypothetical protein [Streptacidiphilus sp. PAMC 29251]